MAVSDGQRHRTDLRLRSIQAATITVKSPNEDSDCCQVLVDMVTKNRPQWPLYTSAYDQICIPAQGTALSSFAVRRFVSFFIHFYYSKIIINGRIQLGRCTVASSWVYCVGKK